MLNLLKRNPQHRIQRYYPQNLVLSFWQVTLNLTWNSEDLLITSPRKIWKSCSLPSFHLLSPEMHVNLNEPSSIHLILTGYCSWIEWSYVYIAIIRKQLHPYMCIASDVKCAMSSVCLHQEVDSWNSGPLLL